MNSILPYKYPTTTLLLDDEESFLESLRMLLYKPGKCMVFASKPDQALDIINDSSQMNIISCINKEENSALKLDYSKIPDIAKNPHRTREISVIVVDYHMPEINGIEFCKKIKDSKCQKILLTANKDQDIVVRAFNEGLIQQYISKQDQNVDKLIISAIEEAEKKFFSSKFNSMVLSAEHGDIFFKNSNFQTFITGFFEDNNIIEHYIFGKNGNLLCVDKQGLIPNQFD